MRNLRFEVALARRRRRQSGTEMIEFGILAMLMVPLFGGMFFSGLGLIRANQANQVGRDINTMYIKGIDFSKPAYQTLATNLAGTLNLQTSGGNGLVILTQVLKIGPVSGPICVATIANGDPCTNANKFVFTQRITIGDTSLPGSDFGNPTAVVNSSGIVQDYASDGGAALPNQSAFSALWTTPLVEGQSVYITETYFKPMNAGGAAVHTRNLF